MKQFAIIAFAVGALLSPDNQHETLLTIKIIPNTELP